MKKTKIIIPAIGMLLLSTAASITGTVAWFSMNTQVTATGMTIEAKGDQVFMQIINASGTFQDGNGAQVSATAVTASATLPAVNVVKSVADGVTTAYDGTSAVWVTNHSSSPNSAAASGLYTDVTSNVTSYALINTFRIRLDPLAGADVNAPDPLKVSAVTFDTATAALTDPMRNAVSVLVSCTVGEVTNYQLFKQDNSGLAANIIYTGGFAEVAAATNGQLTDAAFADHSANGTEVKVYVFFDGDNQSAYTNNITANGYGIGLSFSVDY